LYHPEKTCLVGNARKAFLTGLKKGISFTLIPFAFGWGLVEHVQNMPKQTWSQGQI
jgi:hypothetical protein